MSTQPAFDDHDQHTNYYPYGAVSYWKDNGMSSAKPDDWDFIRVQINHGPYQLEMTYPAADANLAYTILQMMERAWMRGKNNKAEEIRRALDIKER